MGIFDKLRKKKQDDYTEIMLNEIEKLEKGQFSVEKGQLGVEIDLTQPYGFYIIDKQLKQLEELKVSTPPTLPKGFNGNSKQSNNSEKILQQKRVEAIDKIMELSKDITLDMDMIKKKEKEFPNSLIFNDVKNAEEFKFRDLALSESMKGNYQKAIEYCDQGLKHNSESAYLFYMRGRSKGDTGNFEEGLKDLKTALKIKPDFADVYVEIGYIKQKMGDMQDAEQYYTKARSLEPSIALPQYSVRDRYLWAFFVFGNVEDAPDKNSAFWIEDEIIKVMLGSVVPSWFEFHCSACGNSNPYKAGIICLLDEDRVLANACVFCLQCFDYDKHEPKYIHNLPLDMLYQMQFFLNDAKVDKKKLVQALEWHYISYAPRWLIDTFSEW
jgi:tetratricopeptide (TPR) repeat protein